MRKYYTMREVGELFCVSRATIYRWMEAGEFPLPVRPFPRGGAARNNSRLKFLVDEVDAHARALETARKPSSESRLSLS